MRPEVDLVEDLALARAVAQAAATLPWVAYLGGEAATYGPNETIRGVSVDRSGPEPALSVSFAAEYVPGVNLRELAERVRRAALRAARETGAPVSRVDVTVHDLVVPAEMESS